MLVVPSRGQGAPAERLRQPPELEVRDIGDLTQDQFRGIFRFNYSGDAFIVLRTKVQVSFAVLRVPTDLRAARLRVAIVCHISGVVIFLDTHLYCCIQQFDLVLHFAWVLGHTDVPLW